MTPRISREELDERIAAGNATFVEALSAAHYAAEHLPSAVNVPAT